MHAPLTGQAVAANVGQLSALIAHVWRSEPTQRLPSPMPAGHAAAEGTSMQLHSALPADPRQGLVGVHDPKLALTQPAPFVVQMAYDVSLWHTLPLLTPAHAAGGCRQRQPAAPGAPTHCVPSAQSREPVTCKQPS
jgi:hypothetical protein